MKPTDAYNLTRVSRVDLLAQDHRRWLKRVVAVLQAEYTAPDWARCWGMPWLQETANIALYLLIVLAALSLPVWMS